MAAALLRNHIRLLGEDYERICRMLEVWTGIRMTPSKQNHVVSRLGPRVIELGLPTFSAYLDLVAGITRNGHIERREAINRLTTNKTSFFRDAPHFDVLESHLSTLSERASASIWSAGCSSGEEPYSIAMTAIRAGCGKQLRILATDLCDDALASARRGVYPRESLEGVESHRVAGGFDMRGEAVHVRPSVRDLVSFVRLNLMDPWPMQGPFTAVFCRNVMIYFSDTTRRRLVERFCDITSVGGLFFVGSAEAIPAGIDRFEFVMPSVYRRLR